MGIDRRLRWLVIVVAVALLALYLHGAAQQATIRNTDVEANDQSAYMDFSRALMSDPSYIDGNRMPLYPFMLRPFASSDDATFFETGKQVGIALSVVLLIAVALVFYRAFPPLLATNLTLITAFTIFLYKAGYVQPELLFFTLYFFGFLLMCRLFIRPSWKLALLTGIALGVAMLLKSSVTLAVALFAVFFALKVLTDAFRRTGPDRPRAVLLHGFGSLALVVGVFLLLLSGYIASSLRIFGVPYYNVNTTFYVWYDGWGQAERGTKAHGDRVGWPDMPADELPSMGKYLREHSLTQMLMRVTNGLDESFQRHCTGEDAYGYCKYVAVYGLAAVAVVVANRRAMWAQLRRHLFLVLFCAAFLLSNVLFSAWWVPINSGRRFMLAGFLPLMFSLAYIISLPDVKPLAISVLNRRVTLSALFNVAVLAVVVLDIYAAVAVNAAVFKGGD